MKSITATRTLLALFAFFALMMVAPAAYADELAVAGQGASDGADARKTVEEGLYNLGSASQQDYSIAVKGASSKAGAAVIAEKRSVLAWAQKWALIWDSSSGYYKVRNLNSRMYLGVAGTVKSGAAVKQYKNTSSRAQLWEAVKAGGGVMLKAAGTNLALEARGKKGAPSLALGPAGSETSQVFKLREVQPIEDDQTYFIRNLKTGKRLKVAGSSRKANAKISLAKAKSVKSQKFRLLAAGSAYRLQNVRSCYYIGTKGSNTSAVRQIKAKSAASKLDVKFDLEACAFTIGSLKTRTQLDASTGKLALRAARGGDAQLFSFTPTYAFKLFLNPGHGANSNGNGSWDPGAIGSGHTEAEFTYDLAKRVVKELAGTDVKVINGSKYKLAFSKRMPKAVKLGCDAIVSIHFDAGGDSGTLGMVGVQGKAKGSTKLCNLVRKSVVKSLKLPDRGNVSRSDITCVNGKIPSALIEVCYMDNSSDVAKYLKRRDAVARGFATGIVKATRNRSVVR